VTSRREHPRPRRPYLHACVPGLLIAPLLAGPPAPAASGPDPAARVAAAPAEGSPGRAEAPAPTGAPAGPAAAAAQDAATILSRAADRHRSLSTLQTAFTQEIHNPLLERDETSRGTFYYRSPLRYRIAFDAPPDDVVVSDGSRVWIYLPSSQPDQVIRSPVEGARGFAPYQFLDEFRGRYEAALVGKEPVGGRPSWHLALTPDAPDAAYARAEIWVDAETSLTTAMEVEEPNGVVRRFTLGGHRLDAPLADSLFRFRPPPNVEVFDR
jgi:outer membrane lipoprotein carrier protein